MSTYSNEVVRIAELAGDDGVIEAITFEDCEIRGPAVLEPSGADFKNCSWSDSPESRVWVIPDGRFMAGTIRLTQCRFEDCRFVSVGVAGPADLAAIHISGLAGPTR